jgi:hypothetical protein
MRPIRSGPVVYSTTRVGRNKRSALRRIEVDGTGIAGFY